MRTKPLIYLGCPFASADPNVMSYRFVQVTNITANLMEGGNHVFSPITHNYYVEKTALIRFGSESRTNNFEFCMEYDLRMLAMSDILGVCVLEGWKESKGLKMEMDFALQDNIPIIFFPEIPMQDMILSEQMKVARKEWDYEQMQT